MYRRKGFYQKRGYKLAVSRYKASGIFTRTYKFYCNPYLLYNENFQAVEYTEWTSANPPHYVGNYLPVSYSSISYDVLRDIWLSNFNSQAKQFTGPCNMYGVYNLPLDVSRVLGYREYTVINLSQLGLFWLFWNNNFINQRELLVEDLKKYSYYRALSVTVKFAPRYSSIPGKISSFAPTTMTLPAYQLAPQGLKMSRDAAQTGTWTGGSTVAAGGAWSTVNNPQISNNGATSLSAIGQAAFGPPVPVSTWDKDAYTLIGYLIPGSPSETSITDPINFPGWSSSVFGRTIDYPNLQWFSSFRKSGYPRSYITRNKPTSFKFLLPQTALCAQMNLPNATALNTPQNLYGYYTTSGDNKNSPFVGHKECLKPGLMPAEGLEIFARIYTDNELTRQLDYPKYWNTANCNLFIPGTLPEQLLNRYKISFSYKFQYYARVYDDN